MPRRVCSALVVLTVACGPKPAGETAGTSTTEVTSDAPSPASTSASTTSGASATSEASATGDDATSSATTGSPTTGPESSTSSTGMSWIMTPDAGGHGCNDGGGGGKQCDPWTQDCPAGEKCVPTSDGCEHLTRFRCTAVVPMPAGVGEPCTLEGDALSGIDDCEFGATCWFGDPDTLTGTCVALCTGTPDQPACAPTASCVLLFNEDVGLCLPPCDPLQQTCPEGHSCHPNPHQPDAFACLPDA